MSERKSSRASQRAALKIKSAAVAGGVLVLASLQSCSEEPLALDDAGRWYSDTQQVLGAEIFAKNCAQPTADLEDKQLVLMVFSVIRLVRCWYLDAISQSRI